jgi:hypothetical protein
LGDVGRFGGRAVRVCLVVGSRWVLKEGVSPRPGVSGGAHRPSTGVVGDIERREPGEVHRGSQQREVGVHFGVAADAGAAAAVPASHQVTDLPFDLRAGRGVVSLPCQVALPRAGAGELLLVEADVDRPSVRGAGAPSGERMPATPA